MNSIEINFLDILSFLLSKNFKQEPVTEGKIKK